MLKLRPMSTGRPGDEAPQDRCGPRCGCRASQSLTFCRTCANALSRVLFPTVRGPFSTTFGSSLNRSARTAVKRLSASRHRTIHLSKTPWHFFRV